MIKAAIAGATGYTGGELMRILLNHPDVEITSAYSTTSMGLPLHTAHRDLLGESDLLYTNELGNPDVLFLCLGHGLSRDFLEREAIPAHCKIVDLGNDFRLDPLFTGKDGSTKFFVYGLTDVFTEEIKGANYVANPGCFATAIQCAVAPLASSGSIIDDVHVTAITGSTGAGKKLAETGHFSYRSDNISIYKPFTHQHLGEIYRTIKRLSGIEEHHKVNFVPMRGDFTRGIFASVYTKWRGFKSTNGEVVESQEEAVEFYKKFYSGRPFITVSDSPISLKEVVNTNKCFLHIEMHNGYIHITSIIDNLVKGAAGQAVENMNLMFGLDERAGLKLKPSAF